MHGTAQPFEDDIRARLRAAARRAACHAIKSRARVYARQPLSLESVFPGPSVAAPATLIAVADHLIEQAQEQPARWFGFGGEVSLINARAVQLLGRTLRQVQETR